MASKQLYLIRCAHSKTLKIGISTNPARRIKALQTGHPHKLELLWVRPSEDAREDESYLHKALYHHRLSGEWFTAAAMPMIDAWVQRSPLTANTMNCPKIPRTGRIRLNSMPRSGRVAIDGMPNIG